MLFELANNNRGTVRHLFNNYPCLHGSVAAVIEGDMGKIFTHSRKDPRVAVAVLDFSFLAGDPDHKNAPLIFNQLRSGNIVIAPTPAWRHHVTTRYAGKFNPYHREAFRSDKFDMLKLRRFSRSLPDGFVLRQVGLEEVTKFKTNLHPALVYNFRSHEEFIKHGIGLGILYKGLFVSGASSAAIGGGKLEIEIQTRREFRRRGLARAVASALILHCLDRGIEPCWDAANEASSSLAKQLGFFSTGKYDAYILRPPEA